MADSLSQGLARQVRDVIRERGARCVLRRTTMTTGPAPLPSPPVMEDPVLDGPGGLVIAIRATVARGILDSGDILTIGGVAYIVTGTNRSRPVTANVPGFDGITVTAAVTAADGAPVMVTCTSDVRTYAMINSFPRRLVDGTLILASDVDVILPAYKMPEPIPQSDRIAVAGKERTIISVSPIYVRDVVIQWRLQAR